MTYWFHFAQNPANNVDYMCNKVTKITYEILILAEDYSKLYPIIHKPLAHNTLH